MNEIREKIIKIVGMVYGVELFTNDKNIEILMLKIKHELYEVIELQEML